MPDSSTPSWPDPRQLEIQPSEVAAMQQAGSRFELVDCREPDEWDLTRIHGARLVPLSNFAQQFSKDLKDPSQPIVVYCHHGMRSAKAAQFLRHQGFANVWSMARGIEGWSLEIDPAVPRY